MRKIQKQFPIFRNIAWLVTVFLMCVPVMTAGLAYAADDQVHELSGKWEFYWGQLLEPARIDSQAEQAVPVDVPSSWKGYTLNGAKLPAMGYATYRFRQEIPDDRIGKEQAVSFRYISSAYRIWINGVEQSGSGIVGENVQQESPFARAKIHYFTPQSKQLELVVQVSNHSYAESGIIDEVMFGGREAMDRFYFAKYVVKPMLLIGVFVGIGLYHLIMFGFRRDDRSMLWLGCLGFAFGLYYLFMTEHLVLFFSDAFEWAVIVKIGYIMGSLSIFLFALFTRSMFPQEVRPQLIVVCGVVNAGIIGYFIFWSTYAFTVHQLYFNAWYMMVMIYFALFVGLAAVRNRREGARLNTMTFVVLFAGVVNDSFYYAQLPSFQPVLDYVLAFYFLVQAAIISRRIAWLDQKNKNYSLQLSQVNVHLEEQVKERTMQLIAKNEDLLERDQIRVRTMTNVAHDLISPLVGAQSALMVLEKETQLQEQRSEVVHKVVHKLEEARNLVEHLIELVKLETKSVPFHLERILVRTWMERNLAQFIPQLAERGVALQCFTDWSEIDGELEIDPMQLKRVLQNLFDNALTFNVGQAPVGLGCRLVRDPESAHDALLVEVTDRGVGMDEHQAAQVFDRFYTRKAGSSEGKGIGLAIVKEIVQQHRGTCGVRSKPGKGSTFYFTLPVQGIRGNTIPDGG